MTAVEFRGIRKEYHHRAVLQDINLTIENNTFSVVFGEPSCGKSVLMRLLTGLEKPSAGQVFLRGADMTKVSPGERNIGYVPQSFALYPHYKVFENIAYPLTLMGVRRADIDPIVRQTAELLRIGHLLQKRPDQLSGGEKQRVAIARGIVKNTEIFVMDDPLTGLDFKLREQLFDDLKRLQESLQATVIYTTSDPLEALMLAEQVNVLDGGRIIESGALEQVFHQPQNARTLMLLGYPPASLIDGSVEKRGDTAWCKTSLFEFPVKLDKTSTLPNAVQVGVRPQNIRLGIERSDGWLTKQAQIMLTEDLGGELVVYMEVGKHPLLAVARHDEAHLVSNEHVTIGILPESLVLFAPDNGKRLGQGTR